MKSLKYILSVFATGILVGGLTSCNDFLDTKPSTSVDDVDVFETTSGAQSALNGCYYQMRAYNSGGADRGDDYGIPSIQMISDVCGEDVMSNGGGWYIYNYNYWGETRGDIFRSSQLWTFHYRLINNLNSVIAYVDDSEGDDLDKQYIKGQALAMRGWAYFDLARLFQQTYIIAKDMPGVPIYTEPTTEKTEGKPRGTLEETYQQILSDLTTAEPMLEGFVRSTSYPNVFNQAVVQGILSEVYQVMNNWAKSEEYAKKVLAQYPLTTAEKYENGFNDHMTDSWIWSIKQTEEQNMGDYSPFAMWYNNTRKCWTFHCFILADDFVSLFDEDDIRYKQMEQWNDGTKNFWVSFKFRDNEDCRGSMIVMRSDEMLLNAAEACARQGKEAEAKELLWQLQDLRNAKRTEATGNDLVESILLERRKELYGEGFATFDIIRNQKPLLRTGNHIAYGGATPLPARSWRFIYQLPSSEIKNNKALVDDIWPAGDQNPYSGVYEP
ncbi:RagB/SusD family nutrient uptake outer membrane protein [Parabacteroides johnsonii]|uniref:RagB/SusD family nutrient uptake outer membrane protein n=1 Tax=Parabacteroides johnsonii TaxID=387661 RepID=UPI00265CB844|nr:RagB/SusD family nutrient uptake outer membrane protein [Parabacteroides johnsonii]